MTDQDMTEHEVDHQPEASQPEAPRHEAPRPEAAHPGAPPYLPPAPPTQSSPTTRTPFLAALFSVFPGLGNVYNGLYLRGVTVFLICSGLIALASGTHPPEAVLLTFAVIFVWLFNIFDAYRQATLINYGYAPELQTPVKPRNAPYGSGGMVAGIAVFLLGLYGLLRERFDIDLSLLVEYWYLLFMAFGAFLIAQTVMLRRKEEEASAEEDAIDL